MKVVKTTNEKHDQQIADLQLKLNEAERYGQILRLHGVPCHVPLVRNKTVKEQGMSINSFTAKVKLALVYTHSYSHQACL